MENNITPSNNQFAPSNRPSTAPGQAMVSRQAQEVQAAMYVAKTFPRDEFDAYNRIMKACDRKSLAESAMYEYPRGGTKVTGPSIRMAEVLAQNWGNIDFGIMELEQKNGESTVMAYAWDLETNTRQTKIFTVKHERKAKGKVNQLDDPRDIYEMVANQGARRLRACILGVIPGDIVDSAIDRCQETLKSGHKEPLQDRIRKMIAAFETQYQVNKDMLEKYIGCSADAFSENDFIRLSNVFKALRDGMGKREDYFDIKAGSREVSSKTEEAFKQQQPSDNGGDENHAAGTE
ncbi:hypothetical protein EEL32_00360 (plasmid) [Brevibacillus laterosporus]|nr:hypothetical protein [Brevibacillus laterosporus]TPG93541.1 hypothetical protein EEL32_00360 [Brevibacillus laterosporus]